MDVFVAFINESKSAYLKHESWNLLDYTLIYDDLFQHVSGRDTMRVSGRDSIKCLSAVFPTGFSAQKHYH